MLFLILLSAHSLQAWAQTPENYFGSYSPEHLSVVEKYHLQAMRDKLEWDNPKYAWDEVDFILRHFPNHPQALLVATELALRHGHRERAENYFRHAVSLYSNVPEVYLLYGIFLHKLDSLDEAILQYQRALELAPEYAEAHYNIGLAYLEKDNLPLATQHAKSAYALGYPLPGLRKKLRARGVMLEAG
jgi:Tfp pilus assembly protein PilF